MLHLFSCLGRFVAADVNSGAVLELDRLSYELLRLAGEDGLKKGKCPSVLPEGCGRDNARAAWDELVALRDEGLLCTEDDYEERIPKSGGDTPVKALCLHVSHDCNLRCGYCFASTGDFGTGRRVMDAETACRAIDFVIQSSKGRRNIEIDFFGGEPLMAFDTVKKTVSYARSLEEKAGKLFRFTITTNGLLLDEEKIEYINAEMSNVVLSLDGRPHINDAQRKTVSGGGSFGVVAPKILSLVSKRAPTGKDYYVRGTFTRSNLDFAEDVAFLASYGFDQLSIEPVVARPEDGASLRREDLPRIFEEYERLAHIMLEDDRFSFFHFQVDLTQGPCVIKRLRGCGAGAEYVAVTPEGDIYPCHQFVGMDGYRLGSLDEGIVNPELRERLSSMNIFTREGCRDCWARFYCSGGCSASNLTQNGDIAKPYSLGCEMEKKRLECAIALSIVKGSSERDE